jgi:hypothetical protein
MSWGNPSIGSPGGGLIFAKRKKNLFKGPMLNTSFPSSSNSGAGTGNSGGASRGHSHSRSTSLAGRRSGEIIQEEDEDEIEEVDAFSPITGPGEIEETIFEAPVVVTNGKN